MITSVQLPMLDGTQLTAVVDKITAFYQTKDQRGNVCCILYLTCDTSFVINMTHDELSQKLAQFRTH